MKINTKKVAFTLAEVLVTLAIIGVVASLTIPSLIKSYQDNQLLIKFKKEFSTAAQAVKILEAQNGIISTGDDAVMIQEFNSVLHAVKLDRWKNISGTYYTAYKDTSNGWDWTNWCWYSAQMKDGSSWCFVQRTEDCSSTYTTLHNICGDLIIDVNGAKSPNMYGKDLFYIWIVKKNGAYTIYPQGSNGDGLTCVSGGLSRGCARYALLAPNADAMP